MPGPSSLAFAWIAAGACLLAVVGTLVALPRLRGAAWLRVVQRLGLVLLCQVTALAVVLAVVNVQNLFYTSWSELFGGSGGGPTVAAGSTKGADSGSGTVDGQVLGNVVGPFTYDYTTGLYTATLTGTHSGFTGQILVWLPPGTKATSSLPALLSLPGVPGDPIDPFNGMHLAAAAEKLIKSGAMRPTAIVGVSITSDGRSHDCANVAGGEQIDTWLTTDVPATVGAALPVSTSGQWSVIGPSSGGECAVRLALAHPARFGPAVALSADSAPDSSTSGAKDLTALVAAGSSTPVQLLLASSPDDTPGRTTATALQKAAGHGVTVTLQQVAHGGHNWGTWAAMTGPALTWIAQHSTH